MTNEVKSREDIINNGGTDRSIQILEEEDGSTYSL